MRWNCLGHAMWLVEAAGLRLLFDPVLGDRHHAGVFGVFPRRSLDEEAIAADFILVSHRHGDHFDVPSLHRLAQLDPASVVVTPDELVAWAARAVGFETVHLVPMGQKLELDGVRVVTTPSVAELEWGAIVETRQGWGWNQVDTVLRDADQVRDVVAHAAAELGRAGTALDLAFVRWQPLLEIAAITGNETSFPYREYDLLLRQISASGARTFVPTAAGQRLAPPHDFMCRHVFPLPEHRFLADVVRAAPEARALPNRIGASYVVEGGEVDFEEDGAHGLVRQVHHEPDPAQFDPFELPDVFDPSIGSVPEETMRRRLEKWVRSDLASALAGVHRRPTQAGRFVYQLEIVWPDGEDAFALEVDGAGATVLRTRHPDWDVLNRIAGSPFHEVIEGRFHWGDVLLGGNLRTFDRAYRAEPGRLRPGKVGPAFLYHALPYERSAEQAARAAVRAALQA